MSDSAANHSKPLENVSSVSGDTPKTRHSKSSTVSRQSGSCVGKVGSGPTQRSYAGEKNRAPSKRARTLREALHAAVDAYCDVMDSAEPERRVAARVVAVREDDAPPQDTDRAAANRATAKAIVRGWIK